MLPRTSQFTGWLYCAWIYSLLCVRKTYRLCRINFKKVLMKWLAFGERNMDEIWRPQTMRPHNYHVKYDTWYRIVIRGCISPKSILQHWSTSYSRCKFVLQKCAKEKAFEMIQNNSNSKLEETPHKCFSDKEPSIVQRIKIILSAFLSTDHASPDG